MAQYALHLPILPIYAADNFIVSDCNREAFTRITGAWPAPALLLWGAIGSGKSHLGHIWAREHGAMVSSPDVPSPDQVHGPLLLENIERVNNERGLLHIINHCKEQGYKLLLTSALAPRELPFELPDLTSRLRAIAAARIAAPDDEVLAGSLRKQLADRQLKVEEEVIAYMVPRIERSFASVATLVEQLDKEALARHKNITIPFVKSLLRP